MFQYLARRILLAVPTLLAVSVAVFLALHLAPGDPALMFIGDGPVTPERIEETRRVLGLNKSLPAQYMDFLRQLARGELRSARQRIPVVPEVLDRAASSAELAASAFVFATLLGLGLGIVSALSKSTLVDLIAALVVLLGVSLPVFWLALMLIFVFSIELRWLPSMGAGGWAQLVLPSVALGFISSALPARIVRSSILEVLRQQYVTTARSKGLPESRVVRRHILRNMIIPVLTVAGLQLGTLLSGAVITETVFARPGVGKLLVDAILNKDFPLVQGAVLFIAGTYIFINLAVDLSYAYFDPRVRFE